jgi:alkanesulfonate monooxygenase SsuD/methylene tetrahydromethanopterin reductase-like flavin-dependent oxidoreductase (luciferase family)
MRIGIGLPAAVPEADMTQIGSFAAQAEQAGFASVGVIDRLVYDNLDPLVALTAAAACTSRIGLISTVVNVNWRANPRLLAKQISSVVRVSGGRFTAGLGMVGWPADYEASDIPPNGPGRRFAAALAVMDEAWRSSGARPSVALGGLAPAAITRSAAPVSEGWVAPLFGFEVLQQGIAAARDAWARSGRAGLPRVVTGRYFSLGPRADEVADAYLEHYYGAEYFAPARSDTLTSGEGVRVELARLAGAGCTDVVLYPCSGDLDQVERLSQALDRVAVS